MAGGGGWEPYAGVGRRYQSAHIVSIDEPPSDDSAVLAATDANNISATRIVAAPPEQPADAVP